MRAATTGLPSEVLLDKGYRQMYNLEFNSAHATFADYERANPTSAMGPVSDAAAYLFTELDRLNILRSDFLTKDESFFAANKPAPGDPTIKRKFEDVLGRGQRLADARGWELGERTRVDMHTTLGRAGLETVDTLIMAGIADTRAEAISWALARIRERPAFERLREHVRETDRLRKAF